VPAALHAAFANKVVCAVAGTMEPTVTSAQQIAAHARRITTCESTSLCLPILQLPCEYRPRQIARSALVLPRITPHRSSRPGRIQERRSTQEIEIAALVGLEDVLVVEAGVATFGLWCTGSPFGAAPGELGVIDD
jgi:hypothetical protein